MLTCIIGIFLILLAIIQIESISFVFKYVFSLNERKQKQTDSFHVFCSDFSIRFIDYKYELPYYYNTLDIILVDGFFQIYFFFAIKANYSGSKIQRITYLYFR